LTKKGSTRGRGGGFGNIKWGKKKERKKQSSLVKSRRQAPFNNILKYVDKTRPWEKRKLETENMIENSKHEFTERFQVGQSCVYNPPTA
jgi:hypothetical protein